MFRQISRLVVCTMVASLLLPVGAVGAARGFSWQTHPHPEVWLDGEMVEADWRANFADPRCPMTEHLDARPNEHRCHGFFAEIGVWDKDRFIRQGGDNGGVPMDNFSDTVMANCRSVKAFGPGRDRWQAIWYQAIAHEIGHHQRGHNRFPEEIETDLRFTVEVELGRCDGGKFVIDDPLSRAFA